MFTGVKVLKYPYFRTKTDCMQIQVVESSADVRDFHRVAEHIYANDPNWIPHLKQDIEKIFDPKRNKLFMEGAAVRFLLKNKKGLPIGRIAAFVNPKTVNNFDQPTGGIGFFECIDNQEAANMLFDSSRDWLAKRGIEAMDGPINFGERNQFWGLLIHNFTDPSSYGMNYNPPYYRTLFENYGFGLYFEQYVYKRDLFIPAQPIFVRKYNQMAFDPKYKITNIQGKSWEQVSQDFMTVYNGAWGGHEHFKPMAIETARKTIKALKPIVDRDVVIFVYYDNQPIAFYINIPELNEIFRYVNGNLNLWGKIKFLLYQNLNPPETMVGIVFGVVREYQGKGIEGAMIKWAEDHVVVAKRRYSETILTWIGDFNPKMLRVCENLGGRRFRTLATMRYLFDRSAPFKRAPMVE
ncbi:MAG: hypothetical protein EA392_09245 [Cryomorphaceae bacterium]|nr:MAG: hypothetical protein EA392_09245 [Cryomorphaceae bacterium]